MQANIFWFQMREEKKALRDSKRELEKMAIGRHIGQRGHVMQKQRNTRTNESTQHQNLIGLDEGELDYMRKISFVEVDYLYWYTAIAPCQICYCRLHPSRGW